MRNRIRKGVETSRLKEANALDPEFISFIKNETVNRQAKRKQLNDTLNLVQVKTVYKSFYRGRLPDPSIRDDKNIIIQSILNKVESAPSNTPKLSIKRKRKPMTTIAENIIELPNPVPKQPKLSFELIRVPGDGDCFYHAVRLAGLGPLDMRRSLIRLTSDNTVKKRLRSGGWAEDEEIQLVANKYKTCFAIWDDSFDTWQIIYNTPKPADNLVGTQGCKKIVYLYNSGSVPLSETERQSRGTHYDLLKII